MSANVKDFSLKQRRLLAELAGGTPPGQAAKIVGYHPGHVSRLVRDPRVQEEIARLRQQAEHKLMAAMPVLIMRSVATLNDALDSQFLNHRMEAVKIIAKFSTPLLTQALAKDQPDCVEIDAGDSNDNDTAPSPASEPPLALLHEHPTAPDTPEEAMTMSNATNYGHPDTLHFPADPSIPQNYVPVRQIIDTLRNFGGDFPIGAPAQEHAWKCIEDLMRFQRTCGVSHLQDAATTAAKGARSEHIEEGHQSFFRERELEIRAAMDAFRVFKQLEDMLFGLDTTSLMLRRL